MNHELGQSQAKSLGSGDATTPPALVPTKRLRWKLLVGVLVALTAGYGLADAAHSFGWWSPVLDNNEDGVPSTSDWVDDLLATDPACEAAIEVSSAAVDYDEELRAAVYGSNDLLELESLAVKRVTAQEIILVEAVVLERVCDDPALSLGHKLYRASWEGSLADLLDACESMSIDC